MVNERGKSIVLHAERNVLALPFLRLPIAIYVRYWGLSGHSTRNLKESAYSQRET